MLLTVRKTYRDRFSTKFIFAWLKSAIPLWYAASNFNSVNLHKGAIGLNLPLPLNVPEETQREVCELVDETIAIEQQFLREEVELSKREEKLSLSDADSDVEEFVDVLKELIVHVNQHNLKAVQIMTILEGKFSTLYGLTAENIAVIKRALEAHRLSSFYAE